MGKHKEKSKKHKKGKKHKKEKKHRSGKPSTSSSSSFEEWVEKDQTSSSDEDHRTEQDREATSPVNSDANKRHEWMSLPTSFLTESNLDKRKSREENKRLEREREQYNPREHVRELNPYWKDGGDGLPKFKKPSDDYKVSSTKYESSNRYKSSSSWRKKPETRRETQKTTKTDRPYDSHSRHKTSSNWRKNSSEVEEKTQKPEETANRSESPEVQVEALSDKELNILASKLVKAEIIGKTDLVKELKAKLESARSHREKAPKPDKTEEVILTQTDSRGQSRPVKLQSNYGEFSGTQKKKRKVETHQDGQRVRYFPDDDKYSLQQMFENEKFNTVEDQNSEFIKMASKIRKNDDMEDIFADNARRKESDAKTDQRNRDRAVNEHQKVVRSIDSCRFCLQSESMPKHLMVTIGETAFLSLPGHEPLSNGHCLIAPVRHVTCSTLLDENEWEDVMNFRKALTKMFNSRNEDVIFFETAKNLDRYPHMYIECIPVDKEEGGAAPIYFKKAIDECEAEWAQNKKLVSLKNKNVRRAIPKGLPYFFVSFGMEEGFAHVIEEERNFPNNFAQEIIGGMLDLHHRKWRKPRQQNFEDQSKRVVEFSKGWDPFDFTKT